MVQKIKEVISAFKQHISWQKADRESGAEEGSSGEDLHTSVNQAVTPSLMCFPFSTSREVARMHE